MWFPQKKAKTSKPTNPLREEIVHKGFLAVKINTTKTTNTNSNESFKLKPRWLVLTDTKLKVYKTATDSSEDEVNDMSWYAVLIITKGFGLFAERIHLWNQQSSAR
jgi:hypothetical protein